MLALLHLPWPWVNWRASLAAASGRYGTWSVLSSAISWQGTVDNLSPWEPSYIISLSKPFCSGQRRVKWENTLQTNNIISPTPPFLSPLHGTSKLSWDNSHLWVSQCRGWVCQKKHAEKKKTMNEHTNTNTLRWSFQALLMYPSVQREGQLNWNANIK